MKKILTVVIIVLVAVAILMMLYFLDIRAIFGPKLNVNSGKPTSRPWLEEDKLAGPDEIIKMPKPPKPLINEDFIITGLVKSDESDRGVVKLTFNTVGEVVGNWSCEYSYDNRDYGFDADFAGNIDVGSTYSDRGGKDKSKLYFITKGQYSQRIYNNTTGRASEEIGIIYITGWLEKDYSAAGLITITNSEHSWSATYDWQSE